MTEDALRQRQEAPVKHGAYSEKITPEKASTLAAHFSPSVRGRVIEPSPSCSRPGPGSGGDV
jgi:hypothetical protein